MNTNRIKRSVINILNDILSHFYVRKNKINERSKKDVLILPPAEFGSLGDEAMIISIIEYLDEFHFSKSDILSFVQKSWSKRLSGILGFQNEVVMKSKFGNPSNFYKILNEALNYKTFIIVGADILDGHYSSVQSTKRFLLARLLAKNGVKVIVMGASFNNNINPFVKRELKKANNKNFVLNARDLKSHERVSKLYGNAKLTMDVAFLLKPSKPANYTEFINFENNGDFISININPIHYGIYGDALIDYTKAFIDFILTKTKINILLVPHDVRTNTFGKHSDYSLLELIKNEYDNSDRVFFYNKIDFINARNLKYVAYNSLFVITGRMHFAIASLSNRVPVIVMAYQGKFEGMLKAIYSEPERYILKNDSLDLEELITKSLSIISNIENENLLIDSKEIKENSRKNFDVLKGI